MTPNANEGVKHSLLLEMQNGTATLEGSLAVSYKLNILSAYDLAIALHGIYPKGLKIYVHTKTCTWIFTAAFFITAKTWKQAKCLQMVNG